MSDYASSINQQYGQSDLSTKILVALQHAGINPDALTRDDLAPLDEFHAGGREATRALATLAGLRSGLRVLDVGSGIGGPARTLAAEFGCQVIGIDLTEAFCHAAEMLTTRVGLSDRVTFRHASALAMPFDDGAFDVVWTQNVVMNIEDKAGLFRECARVLRPGGHLVIAAIMAGEVTGLHFPVMWASQPALNFLMPPDAFRHLVVSTGFKEVAWEDLTAQELEMSRSRFALVTSQGLPPLGTHVLVPEEVLEKIANNLRNVEEGRMRTIRAVFERTD
jgi:2-polyprenyl-3-methyl-5-hydroxy-6-metoxy-1,4-benzoquinol methylase